MSLVNSCDTSDSNNIVESDNEGRLWPEYTNEATTFKIWTPYAQDVKLNLYETGNDSPSFEEHNLAKDESGTWSVEVAGDLNGTYYTYQVRTTEGWLERTPGIYAQAVGVNGQRAMVVDLASTNPESWAKDIGPVLQSPNDAIIYELHVRDLSIHPESGIKNKGKFLGLAESGTKANNGLASGLDHIKELGITHVHLLPSFEFASLDETRLDSPQFNWGYDPRNYNVPDGSYATDPYKAEIRIREFKEMVKAFHDAGIGVILDVVYNHTGGYTKTSNFNLEYPDYYYRHWENGDLSDASACGNETASDQPMMRKFMIESVLYWANEYHIDGFRFDLMAIHDIETMNELTAALKRNNPNTIVYGEGWTAGDSPLPFEKRALKAHTFDMAELSAFSDDLRDALKGSVFEIDSTGFVSGASGMEESVKFGVVGSIAHPQVNAGAVNYSDQPWANQPWQSVAYVSCHDNNTIFDKIEISRSDATREEQVAMTKLANAVVLTSQSIAFLHAGAEMLRTKGGNHNSYNSPDSINQIDWNWKSENIEVVDYYKNLIALRKQHPAFRMRTANEVQSNLEFKGAENGLISYQISNNANGDSWKNILVVYNARPERVSYVLNGEWKLAVLSDSFDGNHIAKDAVDIPGISMMIAYQE
jgi:pullulanase